MKTGKTMVAILAALLVTSLLPGAVLAQSTGGSAAASTGAPAAEPAPSPALQAAAAAFRAVSAQHDAWIAENKTLVNMGKQVAQQLAQMEEGTPRQWVRARGAAARKVYDQQIRRLQAEMRATLIRLGTLPRGSGEAAALQARVKAIDNEITAAARKMGVIKTEEERLRVFASRLASLVAREEAAVGKVNDAVTASNQAVSAINAAMAARNDAGAVAAYTQATNKLRAAVAEGPKAHQLSRQIIDLVRAEIAARGGPPPEPPPDEPAGGVPAETPAPQPEPPAPTAAGVEAANRAVQIHQQLQDDRHLIEARQQEEEKLRQEINRQLKTETIAAVKNYRDEVREAYVTQIAPEQARLQTIQAKLRQLDPGSPEAQRLRTEAGLIATRIREYARSLGKQKSVLDGLTGDLAASRAPIRKLQEAQRKVEAEIRAELTRLRDAEKAVADGWKAGEAATAAGDQAARDAALDRIANAMQTAINARDRYKLKQAELVSILTTQKVLLATGQAGQ